jgi:kynurenine formamidase
MNTLRNRAPTPMARSRATTTWSAAVLVALFATAIAVVAQTRGVKPPAHVVDLTHTLDETFPYIPVPGITFPFKRVPIATLEKNGVAANRWEIHEHLGTQIDAPNHFAPGGLGLDALPVETLIVPLAVIDISARVARDPDAVVTVADLLAWERQHGRLPDQAAVFMYSGWESRLPDAKAFINADAANTMHFPGFSVEAAEFLARERRVAGLGVDTLSIDPGRDAAFRTHKAWLAAGKWAVEVVARLRDVPSTGATVFVGAPKIKGATGGPVRLLATW